MERAIATRKTLPSSCRRRQSRKLKSAPKSRLCLPQYRHALLEASWDYAFCKAHSTAYGVEAYQSGWFKKYLPAEFMASVLTNGKGFYNPLVYVLECHRLGVKLLPPSINEPGLSFVPDGKLIR